MRSLADEGAGNAAAIVLDRGTGEILAWVGSAGYFDAGDAGAIDYAAVARPAGSTLKPFLYALALERGLITPATVLDDSARGPGGMENADQEFLGPLLPRFALANSRNVPAVRLLERVGLDETWAFFRDLGLHDGSRPARVYGSGLALGVLPVSLEALVRGATALANDGLLVEPRLIAGPDNPAPRRVSCRVRRPAGDALSLRPDGAAARIPAHGSERVPLPGGGEDRDLGRLPRRVDPGLVGARRRRGLGRPPRLSSDEVARGLCGGRRAGAAHLSLRHADQLDGLADRPFPPPRGYLPVRLCATTGLLPGEGCDRVVAEWLAPGQEPREVCDHRAMATIGNWGGD